jgi:hypothetical protein
MGSQTEPASKLGNNKLKVERAVNGIEVKLLLQTNQLFFHQEFKTVPFTY